MVFFIFIQAVPEWDQRIKPWSVEKFNPEMWYMIVRCIAQLMVKDPMIVPYVRTEG